MKLGLEEKSFVYIETLKHLTNLNRASEIKAGLVLTFYGILLGVVFQYLTKVIESFTQDYIFIILTLSWVLLISISIYWSFKCFLPHVEGSYKKNVFFFQDAISSYGDIDAYSKVFDKVVSDDVTLFEQLGQQIYIHSKIVREKLRDVNRSVKYLAFSFVPLLSLLLYSLGKIAG